MQTHSHESKCTARNGHQENLRQSIQLSSDRKPTSRKFSVAYSNGLIGFLGFDFQNVEGVILSSVGVIPAHLNFTAYLSPRKVFSKLAIVVFEKATKKGVALRSPTSYQYLEVYGESSRCIVDRGPYGPGSGDAKRHLDLTRNEMVEHCRDGHEALLATAERFPQGLVAQQALVG